MTDSASGDSADGGVFPAIDTSKPSVARMYDVFLGGKDNYQSDRELAEDIVGFAPEVPEWTRGNRRWLSEVVTWLTRNARIDQFLDLGSGLPTAQNTHQIAQGLNPGAKVVYVDNDPSVIRHGQALLVENDRTAFAAADLTKPVEVLANPAVTGLLDLDRPVGLILALMLHHLADLDQVRAIAAAYVDALPSGSYLAISHACNPRDGSETAQFSDELEARFHEHFPTLRFRTPAEITSLFGDLELLGPGVVRLFGWWPPGGEDDYDEPAADLRPTANQILYCGLARKR
ncbi:MAG TPA: SAM-dependent methyltransferase [Kribbella sp.]